MEMEKDVLKKIEECLAAVSRLVEIVPEITAAAGLLTAALRVGGKVLICGNGGSAADSQHFAAELVGRFKKERAALPALALSTDTSILTSLANDYDFSRVFARQVEALGRPGDILVAISTSGNSPNVLEAARLARKRGISVVGLLGGEGGRILGECDLGLVVPSAETARVQEGHALIIHILCGLIEETMFSGDEKKD